MYRAPSPFAADYQQRAQPYGGQIAPGQVTYTTSTDADGRVVYHPFRAVAASYQTPTGVVSGIQWVPAEATKVLPPGAQPANAEFAASWSRTPISKEEQKALKDWQRDEEKRRKKEEKEAKRQREKEQRSGHGYSDADNELRKARERDAQTMGRRKSFNQINAVAFPGSGGQSGGYPPMAAAGYPTSNSGYPSTPYTAGYNGVPAANSGYEQRERKYSTGVSDLDRQFGDMGLDRGGEYGAERERKISGMSRPRTYQAAEAERARKISNNYIPERPAYQTTGSYSAAGYPNTAAYPAQTAGAPYPAAYGNASPNMRPGESPHIPYTASAYANPNHSGAAPMARPTTPYGGPGAGLGGGPGGAASYGGGSAYGATGQPVYPPGHIMEGKPIPGATPTIPHAVPAGYQPFPQQQQQQQMGMPDPNAGDQGQLAAPDGFSRPINAAQAFTPFEKMKVQDMDSIVDNPPRMPAVLQPHDVYPSDWNRMMQDLCLAWTGRLPAPGRPQKKTSLAAELIDMWNISFFFPRGVEVVLYKGRERRTGPSAGVVDIQLYDEDEESSSSSSSSEDSDSDSGKYPPTMYGQQQWAGQHGSMAQVVEQRHRRREMKAEKKRRRKEKKARRKERAREKRFALYLTSVPNGGPAAAGYGGQAAPGYGQAAPGYGQAAPGYGGQPPAGYGGPAPAGYGVPAAPGSVSGGMPMGGMGGAGMPGGYPTMGAPGYGAVAGGMPMSNQSGGY
ncbi:hypothetical protein K438DRAFT_1807233 [Mycena galopus ATCC 62051]|nr:hypothetical protein K438DRAFT_1807233 [Mycena galopus ATCC 62051]